MTYTLKQCFSIAGYEVLKITRETDRRIWGSTDGVSNHARPSACIGRFDTEDAAKAAIARVTQIRKEHEAMIRAAGEAYDRAVAERNREVSIYLKSVP